MQRSLLLVAALSYARASLFAKLFTDHAVLQRAPASATVYGFVPPGTAVDVAFAGATLRAVADASGTWRVALPPTPAGGPYVISANSSDAALAPQVIVDVLFGEVLLCSGQSCVGAGAAVRPRRASPQLH
jgi:sialate O-acetylesterase